MDAKDADVLVVSTNNEAISALLPVVDKTAALARVRYIETAAKNFHRARFHFQELGLV